MDVQYSQLSFIENFLFLGVIKNTLWMTFLG
uniref:Uncharacterized protein n=1 Tax=Comamonas testosteroni TaxID=285 RepID=A0A6H1Q214_COMTE|nr:hypothetical protein [Comamonas testosteroni]